MSLLLKAVCLFALTASSSSSWKAFAAAAEDVDDADVHVLSDKNFDDFINQDLALVEFYAPWCGHCKQLAPEYAVAATELKELDPPIPLGKVDATVESSLAGRYNVNGYPTLKIFRGGKAFDYNGPRKSSGIVSYMKKQVGPAAKPISSRSELEKFIRSDVATNYAIVGFFTGAKQSQLASSFSLLSTRLRDDFIFGRVSDNPELAAKYGVEKEGVVVFLNGQASVYTGTSKQKELEDFIREKSLPLVGLITEANTDVYSRRGLPIAKLFMKSDKDLNSKNTKYYTNRLGKIADKYRGKLIVAIADKESHKQQLEHLNAQNDDFAFAIEDKNKFYRYDPEDEDKLGKFDAQGMSAFVDKFMDGELKEYVRSERVPKTQGPVTVVVGSTFDEIVNDDEKDVMIEFYAPWCGHCKALEPKYNELGQKLKKEKGVVIAKLDATANDFPRDAFEVKGYPTIYFKPAGKKPVVYEGAREVEDMIKFIKSKGKTFKGKKKASKKKAKKYDDDDE